ncbi:MAG: type II and III secretion system protein [Elusimicrobiota bacterium]
MMKKTGLKIKSVASLPLRIKIFCLFLILTIYHLPLTTYYCFSEAMVEVAVEVTEINNNKASELGVKWLDTIQAGEVSWKDASGLRTPESLPEVPSIIKVGDWSRYSVLAAELKLLQKNGAAQVLSSPKIVTKSGTSAKFLIGGEIPIVASGVSGGSIEWKEYGIKTEILPKILPGNYVDLTLTTEVSRLDWANKVGTMPAILTRSATSNVELKSGQTLALAGMIETTKDEKREGVPILMDIPVLGFLFSRKDITETKTTVLIFITPRILE